MEISKGVKKAIVSVALFLVLGVSAFGGFSVNQGSVAGGVPAAHACCVPPPDYGAGGPTPTPTPVP